MIATVIGVLRHFLPAFLRTRPALEKPQWRAVWALTHCRTAELGGHLCACGECGAREFRFHSCNHRACPQCGRQATAQWVERELGRRVGAPYFMVTFTLPEELRGLFFTDAAKEVYHLLFTAANAALGKTLAHPRWLGARTHGHTAILHTWNRRLQFHPHLHCIVPGAGLDAAGRVVAVKNANFLVPQPVLRREFREAFRAGLAKLEEQHGTFGLGAAVWEKDWGVHLQPFGDGARAIKYLGAYVCRGPIGDSRIIGVEGEEMSFRWKDRAKGDAPRIETIPGVEFVKRYLRHILPSGMRAVRHYGFCHPAAREKRETVAFHTGRPLLAGALAIPPPKPPPRPCKCAQCGGEMIRILRVAPPWERASARSPPPQQLRQPA